MIDRTKYKGSLHRLSFEDSLKLFEKTMFAKVDGEGRIVCVGVEYSAKKQSSLTSETIEGASLSLEGIDDIHGGNGLSLGVLGVCDCITNHIFEKDFQDSTGFFIDVSRNTLDSSSASESSDGRLGDSMDIISQNLSVAFSSRFSKSFSSFSAARHFLFGKSWWLRCSDAVVQ